jgi:hypothetical protein
MTESLEVGMVSVKRIIRARNIFAMRVNDFMSARASFMEERSVN